MTNVSGTRQSIVDRLRGYALLGVIVVNAPFLVSSSAGTTLSDSTTAPDRAAALVTWVLFQGKAYLVFAFLFGYSLTIFLGSVTAKGMRPTRIYLQRLAALFLFGTLHALLLFPGDILAIYAVLGLLMIPLRRCNDRTLKALTVAFILLQAVLLAVLALIPDDAQEQSLVPLDNRLASGGIGTAISVHLTLWPGYLILVVLLQGSLVTAMFALGFLAGRHGLLRTVGEHREAWARARAWGVTVGLPLQMASGWLALRPGASQDEEYLALVLQYLTAPILSMGLLATVVLLPRRGLTRLVEADGRMSLTIYLAESLVLSIIATGWGLGLLGLGPAAALLVAVGTWMALVLFAHGWHVFGLGSGPAERVLRTLTYARSGSRPQQS